MLKLFGFRITPFFLFILAMECMALVTSLYLGILLYKSESSPVAYESYNSIFYTALFLLVLISILTPGFFSQISVVSHIKKTFEHKVVGIVAASLTMLLYVLANIDNLNSKTLFIAAILSSCIGMCASQIGLLGKYWRFLIRSGVN